MYKSDGRIPQYQGLVLFSCFAGLTFGELLTLSIPPRWPLKAKPDNTINQQLPVS